MPVREVPAIWFPVVQELVDRAKANRTRSLAHSLGRRRSAYRQLMPNESELSAEPPSPSASERPADERKHPIMGDTSSIDADLQALRDSWKFPAVVHFCRVFEEPLKLRPFSSELFETALIRPDDCRVFLSELVFKLMTPDRKSPFTPEAAERWESVLHERLRRHWAYLFDCNPLENAGYFELSPQKRLDVLHFITEYTLSESNAIRESVKYTVDDQSLTANILRSSPIGEDARGNRYYMFSSRYEDCRLYREEFPPKKKVSRKCKSSQIVSDPKWTTVCTTIEDFSEFVDKLSSSRNVAERQLHKLLANKILPELIRTEKNRRRAEEKAALLEAMPRKRSSRIQELTKKKEEEEKNRRDMMGEDLDDDVKDAKEKERELRIRARRENDAMFMMALDGRRVQTGPSREERMRLRNERKEMAERGELVVGTKRERTDSWTPLGDDVKCPKRKRIQDTRPIRDRRIRRLVAISQERFAGPAKIRKEFNRVMSSPGELVRSGFVAEPPQFPPRQVQKVPAGSGMHMFNTALAHQMQSGQSSSQGVNPALLQQQMLLMQQRRLLQQRQQQQQQQQQQMLANRGQTLAQRHGLTAQLSPQLGTPQGAVSPILQQHLQNYLNQLPQHQKETIMAMPPQQRNQVLSEVIRKQMIQQHRLQQLQSQQLGLIGTGGVAGQLQRAQLGVQALHQTPRKDRVQVVDANMAMLHQMQQRQQAIATPSGMALNRPMGLKQTPMQGQMPGVMICPSSVGGMSGLVPNMGLGQSPVRQLSGMNQGVMAGGAYLIRPTQTINVAAAPQVHDAAHANGMRQNRVAPFLRTIPDSAPTGMLVPVSTPAKLENGNLTGSSGKSSGANGQSGHGMINV